MSRGAAPARAGSGKNARTERVPPQAYFLVSAVFHYLGPSFAVLLFARVAPLGVAWLRIGTAAAVFAAWRRPWRLLPALGRPELALIGALGAVLAAMNGCFYLALARLPLSTVGSIEFLGTVVLAVAGVRSRRNGLSLVLAVAGVAAITGVRIEVRPLGFACAFANCGLFVAYIALGHRIARRGGDGPRLQGVERLGAAMLVAAVLITPVGLPAAWPALSSPRLVLTGGAVGVCSSVVPYVTDQLAMARLPRATFALMLALLPMFATLIGAIVLRQIPTPLDLAGIGSVVAGVALHQPEPVPGGATEDR